MKHEHITKDPLEVTTNAQLHISTVHICHAFPECNELFIHHEWMDVPVELLPPLRNLLGRKYRRNPPIPLEELLEQFISDLGDNGWEVTRTEDTPESTHVGDSDNP